MFFIMQNNIVIIIDRNSQIVMDHTEDCIKLNQLEEKIKSFGFKTITINGHSYKELTKTFDKKIETALCHKSQIKKYESHGFNVPKNLKTLAKFRGIQANCKYAEAFQVIKMVN